MILVVANMKQTRFVWKCLSFSPVLQQTSPGRALDQKPVCYFSQLSLSLFILHPFVWFGDKKEAMTKTSFSLTFFPPHQKLILDVRVLKRKKLKLHISSCCALLVMMKERPRTAGEASALQHLSCCLSPRSCPIKPDINSVPLDGSDRAAMGGSRSSRQRELNLSFTE